jgi:hypothetical protein
MDRDSNAIATALAAASVVGLIALVGSAAAQPAVAPTNTKPPSISGTARDGGTLTAHLGDWTGTQPITLAWVWKRCDSRGGNCFELPGSGNREQWPLGPGDVGHRLRITVTARNQDGQRSATSGPTSVVRVARPVAPRNTSPPTISGTAQEGQPLSGNAGQWEGTPPIDLNFFWQRCDRNGASCADIAGATSTQYILSPVDVGDRVRLRIQANNRGGRTNAFSAPTGIVAPKPPPLPAGAVRLPDGKISIPITSVSAPHRLVIGRTAFSPNPVHSRNDIITARFRISDTRGYIVRGALVFVVPLPYGWVTQPDEVATGVNGWATVRMGGNPQLPRRGAIVMFVRARRGGDFVLTGVSNRRLVQMLVALR